MDFMSPQAWALWALTALAAYLGAYAAEKGKLRAAREDKDQILEELANTTQKLKQIEASISNEVWERQWRHNKKSDLYLRLFECFEKIYTRLMGFYMAGASKERMPLFMDDMNSLRAEFQVWVSMARIFTGPDTFAVLHDILNDGLAIDDPSECKESLDLLRRRRRELVAAAQKDFGIGPAIP